MKFYSKTELAERFVKFAEQYRVIETDRCIVTVSMSSALVLSELRYFLGVGDLAEGILTIRGLDDIARAIDRARLEVGEPRLRPWQRHLLARKGICDRSDMPDATEDEKRVAACLRHPARRPTIDDVYALFRLLGQSDGDVVEIACLPMELCYRVSEVAKSMPDHKDFYRTLMKQMTYRLS